MQLIHKNLIYNLDRKYQTSGVFVVGLTKSWFNCAFFLISLVFHVMNYNFVCLVIKFF